MRFGYKRANSLLPSLEVSRVCGTYLKISKHNSDLFIEKGRNVKK